MNAIRFTFDDDDESDDKIEVEIPEDQAHPGKAFAYFVTGEEQLLASEDGTTFISLESVVPHPTVTEEER